MDRKRISTGGIPLIVGDIGNPKDFIPDSYRKAGWYSKLKQKGLLSHNLFVFLIDPCSDHQFFCVVQSSARMD